MPDTTAASKEDIQKALDQWIKIQAASPAAIKKYTDLYENPFVPWPPSREKIAAFLAYYPPEGVGPNTIDATLRDELMAEFSKGSQEAKTRGLALEASAKKHIDELKKAAKKAGKPLPDITPPTTATETTPPLSEERFQKVIQETLETPIKPEKRTAFLQTLTIQATVNEKVDVPKLTDKAIATITLEDELFANPIPTQTFSFTSIATTSLQKATAPLLDTLNTVFPGMRDAALDKIVTQSLQKTMDSVGQNIVGQPWFIAAQRDVNRLFGEKGGRSGISGITGVVSDISASIFRGTPDESTVAYFEMWHMQIMHGLTPPSFSQFRAATLNAKSWAIQLGKDQAAGGLLKFFGVGAKAAGVAGKTGLATATAEGGLLASAGGPWGLAALAGSWLLGKAKDGITSLMNTITGREVPGDRAILFILIGAVFIFFIPIFPLLSFVGQNQLNIDTALVTRMGMGGGQSTGPTINCQQTPNAPQCKFTPCIPKNPNDCKWPASGIITQGPFTAAYCSNPAETSHDAGNAANGIDIANVSGGPVYTPRAGTVIEAYTGCADNSGSVDANNANSRCGGSPTYAGYGNHVIFKTDDGYTLIFGHMESAMSVSAGQKVAAGTQLGWMDQTGNSTGTHLHFGVLSGGSVLDFIPKGDTAHAPELVTGCVNNEPSCKKTCPYTPVIAGFGT